MKCEVSKDNWLAFGLRVTSTNRELLLELHNYKLEVIGGTVLFRWGAGFQYGVDRYVYSMTTHLRSLIWFMFMAKRRQVFASFTTISRLAINTQVFARMSKDKQEHIFSTTRINAADRRFAATGLPSVRILTLPTLKFRDDL